MKTSYFIKMQLQQIQHRKEELRILGKNESFCFCLMLAVNNPTKLQISTLSGSYVSRELHNYLQDVCVQSVSLVNYLYRF